MILKNDRCKINIIEDTSYMLGSNNNKKYHIELNLNNLKQDNYYGVLSISVNLFYKQYKIALVGYHSTAENCAILDDKTLTILQNCSITQINVIDGSVISFKNFDFYGPTFGIYLLKTGYIIHGELEIIMLDFNFNIMWHFSGADIFASSNLNKKCLRHHQQVWVDINQIV